MDPNDIFVNILQTHPSVRDLPWFHKCVESYALTGDEAVQHAYIKVVQQVRALESLRSSFLPKTEDAMDAEEGEKEDQETNVRHQYKQNQFKLNLIGNILNGTVVTDKQKQRRQHRAEMRIKRAEMKVAKLKAKLDQEQNK